ncbi:MAG TPA: site-specific integrase [Gemmatimonadales bacterium]|jgi:integrase|nr:site-specific integrase [Gemmatimonadales bacterium]
MPTEYRLYPRNGDEKADKKGNRRERVERWWGDFRRFADVGGKREPLIPAGESLATTDKALAESLANARYQELRRARIENRDRQKLGLPLPTSLHEYARYHLLTKREAGQVGDQWLMSAEMHLTRAVAVFGKDRELSTIGVADVSAWCAALRRPPLRLKDPSIRQHLNSLSNLYRRAISEGRVPAHYNPVAGLLEKPSAKPLKKPRWYEVPEAALYLEAARRYRPARNDIAIPFAYELVATALLTGGRPGEVLGLEVTDVDFSRGLVHFRPNAWRRSGGLKTPRSERAVPLWPQLRTILKRYLAGPHAPPGRLLFPSYRTGEEAMLTDVRKMLDGVAALIGWPTRPDPKAVDMYDFRHTYTTARRQTLDRGHPVSDVTVAHELGHNSAKMIEETYGHLGTIRHRSKVVEYRVAQWRKELGGRLARLAHPQNKETR